MNYTYIVQCADGTLYTGWTNCLSRRMKAHNEGKAGAKYTRAFGAQALAYAQSLPDKSQGLRREAELKKLTRARKEELCRAWQARGENAPGFAEGQAAFGPAPQEEKKEKG